MEAVMEQHKHSGEDRAMAQERRPSQGFIKDSALNAPTAVHQGTGGWLESELSDLSGMVAQTIEGLHRLNVALYGHGLDRQPLEPSASVDGGGRIGRYREMLETLKEGVALCAGTADRIAADFE